MTITTLYSKIHRATVTDANLHYEGSISVCTELMRASNIFENQKVDIVNVNNGERFSTYVIPGNLGEICLNGAASRKVQVGDKIIIIAYAEMSPTETKEYNPKLIFVDDNNHVPNQIKIFHVELYTNDKQCFLDTVPNYAVYNKNTTVEKFSVSDNEKLSQVVLAKYPNTAYIHILDSSIVEK